MGIEPGRGRVHVLRASRSFRLSAQQVSFTDAWSRGWCPARPVQTDCFFINLVVEGHCICHRNDFFSSAFREGLASLWLDTG
jgi:hypothetical protein